MQRISQGYWRCVAIVLVSFGVAGCRPSDVLKTPSPDGIITGSSVDGQSSAEDVFYGARNRLFVAFGQDDYVHLSGELADEYTGWFEGNIDARQTANIAGYNEYNIDGMLTDFLAARSQLLVVAPLLEKYETGAGLSRVGEAYALAGYTELLMAEGYCAGVPLSNVLPSGGYEYGMPLTTDSLLGAAEAHFDSALGHANGNDTIVALASVGLGRTRLDRGNFTQAATATQNVPTSFVYNAFIGPTNGDYSVFFFDIYLDAGCGYPYVSDHEGTNGLNFLSAGDPRLQLSTTVFETCDAVFYGASDSVWSYPVKLGNPVTKEIVATGVEARLIEAEAALHAGDVTTWASDLDTLRSRAPTTYLALANPIPSLTTDSTTGASPDEQVDVMFRERAFWLFSTGTRLGDLRRLIRQYSRDQSTVFPVGAYAPGNNPQIAPYMPNPLLNYGTDVAITLPTTAGGASITNPNYKGCITPTTTA